jgi:hypothetical protein
MGEDCLKLRAIVEKGPDGTGNILEGDTVLALFGD